MNPVTSRRRLLNYLLPACMPLLLLLVLGCENGAPLGDRVNIDSIGSVYKVTYHLSSAQTPGQVSDSPAFTVTDRRDLKEILTQIKYAGETSRSWTSPRWHQVRLYTRDSVLTFFTNERVIGLSETGPFYYLAVLNFITERETEKNN